jgi:hypothetical protein
VMEWVWALVREWHVLEAEKAAETSRRVNESRGRSGGATDSTPRARGTSSGTLLRRKPGAAAARNASCVSSVVGLTHVTAKLAAEFSAATVGVHVYSGAVVFERSDTDSGFRRALPLKAGGIQPLAVPDVIELAASPGMRWQ